MAANFPNSPSINDTFTSNGVTFKWDGSAWKQPASPGVKGLKGDQGEKGEKGQKGEKGEKGTKGEIGSSGNPGGKGDKGAPGADGSDGSDGDKGQKGQDGTDATGAKGEKGAPGADGSDGSDGSNGAKGQKGEDNSTKGEKGQKGQDGADATGSKGEKGQKGQDGTDATGTKGEKGQKGQDGADATGAKGEKGQKGQDGTDATGTKGEKGQKGIDGNDATGTKGEKGQKGTDGDDGASVKGQKGDSGADNSTKGQKGEVGTATKGQKGESGQKGEQGASGSATISNNADNRVITGGTGTNLNAEQNLTFDGSTLEVTGTGTPTIESASNLNITANTTTFSGNILPNTDSSHNIGSNGVRFANGYFDTLYGDGSNLTGISGGGGTSGINTIGGVVNIANDLDVDGHTNLDNVSVSGVTTFTGAISAPSLTINDWIYHAGNTNTFIGFESDNTIRFQTNGSDKLKINMSGHVILADDNNTYIHHPANDTIAVTAGGSEKLRIDTSGVVGNPDLRVVGSVSIGAGHPASNFYSGADDLVVANFAQDTGISIMSGTSNDATIAFGSTTFGSGAIQARLFYENDNDDFIMQTITEDHDIKLQSAGKIELGSSNDVIMTIEDPDDGTSHGVEVSGTIYPKAPVGNLGLSGVRWNNIYGNYLHGNGASITNIPYSALTGTPSIPSIPSSLPAKSIFAHNYSDTTYGSNAYNSYQNHLSASLTPSNSNNRVVVMASFQLKRGGSSNNNWYAYAKLAGGGDLQNIEIVRTNGGYSDDTSYKLIAYDAAGNTSSRTYYLQVQHSSTSSSYSSVSIRHASIVAIELSSS